MNLDGKQIRVKDGVYHLSSHTHIGGMTGKIIRSEDPYFMVEFDKPLGGFKKTILSLHWSHLISYGKEVQHGR